MPSLVKTDAQYAKVLSEAKLRALGVSTQTTTRVGSAVFDLVPLNVYQVDDGAIFEMTKTTHDVNGNPFEQFVLVLELAVLVAKVNLLFFLAAQPVLPNPNTKFRAVVRASHVAKRLAIDFSKIFPGSTASTYDWSPMRNTALQLKDILLHSDGKSKGRKVGTLMNRYIGTPHYKQYMFPNLNDMVRLGAPAAAAAAAGPPNDLQGLVSMVVHNQNRLVTASEQHGHEIAENHRAQIAYQHARSHQIEQNQVVFGRRQDQLQFQADNCDTEIVYLKRQLNTERKKRKKLAVEFRKTQSAGKPRNLSRDHDDFSSTVRTFSFDSDSDDSSVSSDETYPRKRRNALGPQSASR